MFGFRARATSRSRQSVRNRSRSACFEQCCEWTRRVGTATFSDMSGVALPPSPFPFPFPFPLPPSDRGENASPVVAPRPRLYDSNF